MLTKFKAWIKNKNNVCDLLLLSGMIIIIATTLKFNLYLGMYLLGLVLIASSFFIFKFLLVRNVLSQLQLFEDFLQRE